MTHKPLFWTSVPVFRWTWRRVRGRSSRGEACRQGTRVKLSFRLVRRLPKFRNIGPASRRDFAVDPGGEPGTTRTRGAVATAYWRRVEDHQRRHDPEADLRLAGHVVHRLRRRHRPEAAAHRLRGLGRTASAAWAGVTACTLAPTTAARGRTPPKGPQHIGQTIHPVNTSTSVFVAAQGPVWTRRRPRPGTRRPTAARREARALRGRRTRRERSALRPARSRRDVRDDVPAPPQGVDAHQRRHGPASEEHRTAATRGSVSRTACRPRTWASIGSRRRRRGGTRSSRSSRPRTARAASTAAATPARAGRAHQRLHAHEPAVLRRAVRGSRRPASCTRSTRSADERRRRPHRRRAGETHKHVDNHHVDRSHDPRHLLVGCDGGLYRELDRCATWRNFGNPPMRSSTRSKSTTRSRSTTCTGGTQDNNTQGGPSRTNNARHPEPDWFITVGGDGFQPASILEPEHRLPESQHGGLVRYDRATGEQIDIQPQPELARTAAAGTGTARSSFRRSRRRAVTLRRSGSTAATIVATPEADQRRPLARRAAQPPARRGRVEHRRRREERFGTTVYGKHRRAVRTAARENTIYAGHGRRLIHVTETRVRTGAASETLAGVGDYAYVTRVVASQHAAGTVYATYDRHRMGDLKPYVMKSTDMGRTWTNITGDLPANGSVFAFCEDHVDPNLLFVGTEFGVLHAGRRPQVDQAHGRTARAEHPRHRGSRSARATRSSARSAAGSSSRRLLRRCAR